MSLRIEPQDPYIPPFHLGKPEKKRDKRSGKVSKAAFSDMLERETTPITETQVQVDTATVEKAKLQLLFDEIFVSGRALCESPSYERALKYRAQVRKFMLQALNFAYTVKTVDSRADVVRKKRYSLVQEVNAAMANMIEGLRIGQKGPLDLLQTINAINGILVDILG